MKTLPTSAARYLFPLAIAVAMPSAATAQDAEDILITSLEKYEQRMEGIENYTVVSSVESFETEVTFVRTEVEGHTAFLPRINGETSTDGSSDPYRLFPKIAERAEVRGKETVDGAECWILAIDDFSGLEIGQGMATGTTADFSPKNGTFCIDTSDYVIRRMHMEGEVTSRGETRPMTADATFSDYRNVEGMLHPFSLHIVATGITAGASSGDDEQSRKELAKLEKQLEDMDPNQRAMVEGMLKPQLEKLRKMLDTGDVETTLITKEVRVNEDLP